MPISKWQCNECRDTFASELLLTVHIDHPKAGFDRVALSQCPECGYVDCFTAICDEPGCTKHATCGWPTTSGGYRNTCHEHWDDTSQAKATRPPVADAVQGSQVPGVNDKP